MRNNRQKKEAGRITHSKTTAALLAQAGDKVPEGRALPARAQCSLQRSVPCGRPGI